MFKLIFNVLQLLTSFLMLYLFFVFLNQVDIYDLAVTFFGNGLEQIISLVILMFFMRCFRYSTLFKPIKRIKFMDGFIINSQSYALNNLLPLRLGEFYRIYKTKLLVRLSTAEVILHLIVERLFDFLICAILLLPILIPIFYWNFSSFNLIISITIIIILTVFSLHVFLVKNVNYFQIFIKLKRTIREKFVSMFFTTILIYFIEFLIYYGVSEMFSLGLNTLAIMVILGGSNIISVFLPSPGGLGSFQLGVTYILTNFYAMERTLALEFSIVLHIVLLAPTTMLGCGVFIYISLVTLLSNPTK